jgi:ribonuclease HI
MCKDMRFSHVHLEGDSETIVDAINICKVDRSSLGLLMDDIRSELSCMPHWKMTFIRREGNNVAHVLAKEAISSPLDNCWLFEPPDCIKELVVTERTALASGVS